MHILKQAILPDDPTIEKLFALIEWLQRYWVYHDVSGYMGNLVVGMIRDNDMPHCFEKKLCDTSLIVNCKELVRIIENIPENCPVFMGKFDHAFALFKSGEFYYLYDSNDEMLLDPTESAEIITEILAKDIYKDSVFNQEYPLYMLITSTQDQDEKIIAALDATIDEITQTKPLNQSSLDGCTAILLAVKNAQDKVVTARVARGEDVNIPHRTGLYPIHLAKEISVINELIKAGAKIDQPIKTTVEVLGQLDIDTILCYRSLEGATPLYVLAGNGEPKVLEWLIQQHADINAASAIGLTPLMNAAKSGKLSNVTFLLQHGADVSLTVSPFKGPATIPGTGHHLPILQVYAGGINSNLYEGYNAAMMAAANNHTEVAIELIDGKTNILQRGYDLHSLLTIAAKNGNARLVKKLIECKASLDDFVEMPIGGNATALYLACRGGHLECAELLINAGAGIQPASLDEIPTIFGACVSNNPEILQLLQQHGADIETSFNGITPFGLSITKNCQAAAEYLIKAGATLTFDQVDAKTILEKDNASMLTLVMQHINLTDKQQRAILKIAIEQSSVQCVKLLLKNHSLLSNFAKACKFIQDSLERLKNDPCLTAELIAHCLLV